MPHAVAQPRGYVSTYQGAKHGRRHIELGTHCLDSLVPLESFQTGEHKLRIRRASEPRRVFLQRSNVND